MQHAFDGMEIIGPNGHHRAHGGRTRRAQESRGRNAESPETLVGEGDSAEYEEMKAYHKPPKGSNRPFVAVPVDLLDLEIARQVIPYTPRPRNQSRPSGTRTRKDGQAWIPSRPVGDGPLIGAVEVWIHERSHEVLPSRGKRGTPAEISAQDLSAQSGYAISVIEDHRVRLAHAGLVEVERRHRANGYRTVSHRRTAIAATTLREKLGRKPRHNISIPRSVVRHAAVLGLRSGDLYRICQVATHAYQGDGACLLSSPKRLPRITTKAFAEEIGVTPRAVQIWRARLIERGLLRYEDGVWDFGPLVARANEFAAKAAQAAEAAKAERKARKAKPIATPTQNAPEAQGSEPTAEATEAVERLERVWREEHAAVYPDAQHPWSSQDFERVTRLVAKHGEELVRDAIRYVHREWDWLGAKAFPDRKDRYLAPSFLTQRTLGEARAWADHIDVIDQRDRYLADHPEEFEVPADLAAQAEAAERALEAAGIDLAARHSARAVRIDPSSILEIA